LRQTALTLPGAFFLALQGDPVRYSVRMTGNWRLTFGWDGGAVLLDLEDYH
jgi:proteic killer suppression protein